MSVSGELLCSFELLKPLDSSALKSHIKKGRNKRNSILNSPVSFLFPFHKSIRLSTTFSDDGLLLGVYSLQPCRHKASKTPARTKTLIFHWQKFKNNEGKQLGLGVAFFCVILNCGPLSILLLGGMKENKGVFSSFYSSHSLWHLTKGDLTGWNGTLATLGSTLPRLPYSIPPLCK